MKEKSTIKIGLIKFLLILLATALIASLSTFYFMITTGRTSKK